jgi:hypothetical protein
MHFVNAATSENAVIMQFVNASSGGSAVAAA